MCCGGDVVIADVLFVVQVGDGTTTNRNTPVGVVGLSSGVAMVSLGNVRLFVIAAWPMFVGESGHCVCLIDCVVGDNVI